MNIEPHEERTITAQELRDEFTRIAARMRKIGNADAAARAEVAREWWTSQAFQQALAGASFDENYP